MIEGNFSKKYFSLSNILLVLCSIIFLVLFFLIRFNDPLAGVEVFFFLFFGIFLLLVSLFSLLYNHKAYIKVDNNHIEAKFGVNKKINTPLTDIAFSLGVINPVNTDISTLTLLLMNGKRYTITGLLNPDELSYFINKNITMTPNITLKTQLEELKDTKSKRKKELIIISIGLLVMFVSIFVTVFVTDSKELYDFNSHDWFYFHIFCIVEIITIITTFYFAIKAGRRLISIEYCQYKIRKTVIEKSDIINGNIHHIYTDANYSARLTILGFPQSDDIYYSLEYFDKDYNLYLANTSQVYKTKDELPFPLKELIEITHLFM